MTGFMDYYEVLQVQPFAIVEVIESAYKKLCKKHHPDLASNSEGDDMIKKLNRAYGVLKDETSRQEYDMEWRKHTQNNSLQRHQTHKYSNSHTYPGSGIHNQSHTHIQPYVYGTRHDTGATAAVDSAIKTMKKYFTYLKSEFYRDAYDLLCDSDRRKISFRQFRKWQQSVADAYKILSFDIAQAEYFDDYLLEDRGLCRVVRIRLHLQEETLATFEKTWLTIQKLAIFDKHDWYIHLGYSNVRSLSRKIRENQENAGVAAKDKPIQIKGLLTKNEFLSRAELEAERYNRYGNDFVIGVLRVPGDWKAVNESGAILLRELRKLDALCHLKEGTYAILLAETRLDSAQILCERLKETLNEDRTVPGKPVSVQARLAAYRGGGIPELISTCNGRLSGAA